MSSDAHACLFFGYQVTDPPWEGQDPQDWLSENGFGDLTVAYSGDAVGGDKMTTFVCIKNSYLTVDCGGFLMTECREHPNWRQRLGHLRRILSNQSATLPGWILTSVYG